MELFNIVFNNVIIRKVIFYYVKIFEKFIRKNICNEEQLFEIDEFKSYYTTLTIKLELFLLYPQEIEKYIWLNTIRFYEYDIIFQEGNKYQQDLFNKSIKDIYWLSEIYFLKDYITKSISYTPINLSCIEIPEFITSIMGLPGDYIGPIPNWVKTIGFGLPLGTESSAQYDKGNFIKYGEIPNNVQKLIFYGNWANNNRLLEIGVFPNSITTLNLGSYSLELKNGVLPNFIKTLKMSHNYTKQNEKIKFPNSLESLYITAFSFAKFSFNNYKSFKLLTELDLFINTDFKITKSLELNNIKKLYLCSCHNNVYIEKGSIQSITDLNYYSKDYCIESNTIPNSVTYLSLYTSNLGITKHYSRRFLKTNINWKFKNYSYPQNLTHLRINGDLILKKYSTSLIYDYEKSNTNFIIFNTINSYSFIPFPKCLTVLHVGHGGYRYRHLYKYFRKDIFKNTLLRCLILDGDYTTCGYKLTYGGNIDESNQRLKNLQFDASVLPSTINYLEISGIVFKNEK